MRATQRSLLVLLFVFICNMAMVAPTLRAAPKEKKFVNKKAGFRLQLPPGWHKEQVIYFEAVGGGMAIFELKDKDLSVSIAWGPEQLLGSWEKDSLTIFPSQ